MKFDMSKAWNDAVGLISANRQIIGIVAAVFFFLPSLALSVLAPTSELEQAAGEPERMQAALAAFMSENWPIFLLYALATTIGTLALFALVGRHHRPTVGEAIAIGAKTLLPYLAASLIVAVVFVLAGLVLGVIAGLAGAIVATILGIVLFVAIVIIIVRMILVAPVMVIEQNLNPVAALKRSWDLVKGNTRYVAGFLFLLFLSMIVISAVLGMIFGLLAALAPSAELGLWINAILSGIMGAVLTVVMLTIYMAIYRQLAGPGDAAVSETFE